MPLLKTHTISRAHLEALTERPISDVISPLELKPALATPPFVQNCPLLNVRDLGLVPDSGIRPGLVYRCGMMSDDVETATWLQNNVKAIFDLRHAAEAARMPDPQPEGVQYVRLETVGKFDRLNLEEFGEGDGSAAWKKRYLEILELYAPTIQAVLAHLRDAGTPFVIHCGAGRDRTGLLAGLLHHLAGTPENEVVYDYMLSRVGIEPSRDLLTQALKEGYQVEETDSPGFLNVSSIRPSFWSAFQEGLQEKYGGWDQYIRLLGFSDDDVVRMKANLTKETGSGSGK